MITYLLRSLFAGILLTYFYRNIPVSVPWGVILLTCWDRVTHIWISNLTVIGSDNGLSHGRRQAIIWTNAEIFILDPYEQTSMNF